MAENTNPQLPEQPIQQLSAGQQASHLGGLQGEPNPSIPRSTHQQLGQSQQVVRQKKQRGPIRRFRRYLLVTLPKIKLYDRYERPAENIKISLQMLVGVILTVLIIVKVIYAIVVIFYPSFHFPLLDVSPLEMVGVALAISTAFELAYTLFTDGPDEAVNPLLTGLPAAILLLISRNDITFAIVGEVALLVLALIVLFILKEFFID